MHDGTMDEKYRSSRPRKGQLLTCAWLFEGDDNCCGMGLILTNVDDELGESWIEGGDGCRRAADQTMEL